MGNNVNIGKKREEEIQELFIKNRKNRRFEQRGKWCFRIYIAILVMYFLSFYLILKYDLVPDSILELTDFLDIAAGVMILIQIVFVVCLYIVFRCPYCGKLVGGSRRYGDKCPSCGETIVYYASLEDIEKERKLMSET